MNEGSEGHTFKAYDGALSDLRLRAHEMGMLVAHQVETAVHCAGSYRKTCGNMICMPELTPDRLWPRLSEILDAWHSTSRSA